VSKWIKRHWESIPERNCTAHRDRPAMAALQSQAKGDGPIKTLRRYCLECLNRKIARDPEIPVKRPAQPTQE